MTFEEQKREIWHRILERVHRASRKGKGVKLSAEEAELLALMFEIGVDGQAT
jgi:hypothetical protein